MRNPADDLTSALVHNDLGEDMLAPNEIAPFFILLAVAGNDTTRTAISHGMHLLAQNPEQRAVVAGRPRRRHADRGGGDRARRVAGDLHAPYRDPRHHACRGHEFAEGDKVVLFYGVGQPRPAGVRRSRDASTCGAIRTRTSVSVARARTSASARTSLGGSCRWSFRQLLTRLPDIEVVGEPVPLEAMGIPLVGGIKHLPVRFTPTARNS